MNENDIADLKRDRIIENAYYLLNGYDRKIYSLQEIKNIFSYFYKKYKTKTSKEHPGLSEKKIMYIIGLMPYFSIQTEENQGEFDINPGEYPQMIDLYFKCRSFQAECDYQILHFFSGKIRMMRNKELREIRENERMKAEAVPMPDYIKNMGFYKQITN